MVVICPKCRARLKVEETKLASGGSKFRCPKCSTVLMLRKPAAPAKRNLDEKKILVAHSNPDTVRKIASVLSDSGYNTVTAPDGVDMMVKALKEYPFLSIAEMALPKICGSEICKKLKMRADTQGMKFILVSSIRDKTEYREEPVLLHRADDYIEDNNLSTQLIDKVERLSERSGRQKAEENQSGEDQPAVRQPQMEGETLIKGNAQTSSVPDERVEKAKRLARTVINDIYIYSSAKLDEAVRNNNFYAVFASELKEGKKLYDHRVPEEVRLIADFYKEAIENFISARKKSLS